MAKAPAGRMRWRVIIAQRVQVTAGQASIAEDLYEVQRVWADVEAIAPSTFLAGAQTDRPFTHYVQMRWLDWVDVTHVILRETLRLNQTVRLEVFRIRRVKELDGRKERIELEVELERRE